MVILADDMSNDFEKFKSSTSMIKSDAKNSEELLESIIENMELETPFGLSLHHCGRIQNIL